MNNIDLFGSQTLFRFKGNHTYRTTQGAFISFIIISIIGIRLAYILYDVYQRKDPFVIYKERQVNSPAQFIMNSQSVQLAFGMQEPDLFNHYIDPQVYTVIVKQTTKTTIIDEVTNKKVDKYNTTIVDVGPCTSLNFQNEKTKDYFMNLNYTNMLCINPKQDMVIEGDYSQKIYSYFTIRVIKCTTNCKPEPELTRLLKKAFFAIYFSDVMIDPQMKVEPFQFYTRDNYWMTSVNAPRDVSFQYRNSYVESDFGWFFEDLSTQHFPQFSTTEISYLPSDFTTYFFQMTIRFEKQKENLYQRKYKNANHVISEIGGFTQTLLAIGFLLCSKFSELQLNKEIINEAFNFDNVALNEVTEKEEGGGGGGDETQKNPNSVVMDQQNANINTNRNQKSFPELKKEDQDNHVQNTKPTMANIDHQKDLVNIQQAHSNQDTFNQLKPGLTKNNSIQNVQNSMFKPNGDQQQSNHIAQNEQTQNSFKNQIDAKTQNQKKRKQDHVQTKIILSSIIQKKETIQVKLKNNSIKATQPQQQPNMLSSLQKKQKLHDNKMISMNENKFKKMMNRATNGFTLSLMEYIKFFFWPFGEIKKKKRIIDYSIDKLYYHLDVLYVIKKLLEVDKLKRLIFDQDQLELFEYLPKPIIRKSDVFKSKEENEDIQYYDSEILYQDKRTEIQKTQAAFQAFNNISRRGANNKLDQKLLSHLDPNVRQLFTLKLENEDKILNVDTNPVRNKEETNHFSSFNSLFKQQNLNNTNNDQKILTTIAQNNIQDDSIAPNNQTINLKDIDASDNLSISDIEIPSEIKQQQTQALKTHDYGRSNYFKQ